MNSPRIRIFSLPGRILFFVLLAMPFFGLAYLHGLACAAWSKARGLRAPVGGRAYALHRNR